MSRKLLWSSEIVENTRVSPMRMSQTKVYKDSETGEFVARYFDAGKVYSPADCFESDKQAAIDSALAMIR